MFKRRKVVIVWALSVGITLCIALLSLMRPAMATVHSAEVDSERLDPENALSEKVNSELVQLPTELEAQNARQELDLHSVRQTLVFTNLFVLNSSPTRLGEATYFTAAISTTSPISVQWAFGDGNAGTGLTTTHTYTAPGTYEATVTVTDNTQTLTSTTQAAILNAYTLYLPATFESIGPPVKVGAQLAADIRTAFTNTILAANLATVHQVGSRWIRFGVPRHRLEVSPGVYEWDTLDNTLDHIEAADLSPLPFVYGTPSDIEANDCGPASDMVAFDDFMSVLVARYADQVGAWEFVNEPDAKTRYDPWGPIIGCYGLVPEAYAAQLEVFHRNVRQYDPTALVVSGGLAYDNWPIFERTFWDEALKAGAGQFFDVANFHYYPINPVEFPTMKHKYDEIVGTMSANNVFGKQVWVTETGMWVNHGGSLEAHKNFIVQQQTIGYAAGIENIFWYDPQARPLGPEHIHRWFFTEDREPINGFETYQLYTSKVRGTIARGKATNFPDNIEAYRFITSNRELYVAWSNTITENVTLDAKLDATVTSRDGDVMFTVPAEDGQVTVEIGTTPIYIEFIEP